LTIAIGSPVTLPIPRANAVPAVHPPIGREPVRRHRRVDDQAGPTFELERGSRVRAEDALSQQQAA
jgi:hypothetical protein